MKQIYLLILLLIGISVGLRAEETESEEIVVKNVTTTEYGQLWSLIESDYLEIDSLVVTGPIDASDFETMRFTSREGRLKKINLYDA